jgi:hypothetical protein
MDLLEYQSVIDRLDAAALSAHPRALLHLARLYDSAALFDRRAEVLDSVEEQAAASSDARLAAAVQVERITDLLRASQYAAVEQGASRFLAADDGADAITTARALSALARAVCWSTDGAGRRDVTAMRRSDGYFGRAADLYRAAGLRTSEAAMVPYRAMWIGLRPRRRPGRPRAAGGGPRPGRRPSAQTGLPAAVSRRGAHRARPLRRGRG